MRTDIQTEVRTIHPQVLKELPMEVIVELLKVADDLRTGVIPPKYFDMKEFSRQLYRSEDPDCGTAYCIAGWVGHRLGRNYRKMFYGDRSNPGPAAERWVKGQMYVPPLRHLFFNHPSIPSMAADAIEQYVYNYAADPWKAAGYVEPK